MSITYWQSIIYVIFCDKMHLTYILSVHILSVILAIIVSPTLKVASKLPFLTNG